jgi:hypothetical protein
MISLLILLVAIGVILWLVPMDAGIRRIVVGVVALCVVIWLLTGFGLLHAGPWRWRY